MSSTNEPGLHTPPTGIMFLSFSFPGRVECENSTVCFSSSTKTLRDFFNGVWKRMTLSLSYLLGESAHKNSSSFSGAIKKIGKGHLHGERFPVTFDQGKS